MSRPVPPLLTVAEAAEWLRMKPEDVGRKCRSGALRASKPFKAWLIDPEDIQAYLEAHSNHRPSEQVSA